MRYTFTAAAQRALDSASGWGSRAGHEELDTKSLLVGLLSEPECRAAVMLARHGVNLAAVQRQWPALAVTSASSPHCNGGAGDSDATQVGVPRDNAPRAGAFGENAGLTETTRRRWFFTPDLEDSLQAASERLDFLPRSQELATEHLLLGLVAADHEVSAWLRQQGLCPNTIEAEIRKLVGYEVGEMLQGIGDWGLGIGDGGLTAGSVSSQQSPQPDAPPLANRSSPVSLLRILDAAANRGREGLRVIEDYVRFVLDDRHLTDVCKQLRHDLTAAASQMSTDSRIAARETQEDVGTVLTAANERCRGDFAGVVRANFARLQESLRSLEEFGKIADANLGEAFKQLRYRTYTLERAVEITRGSVERLADVRLYVLVAARPTPDEFERLVRSLVEAGVGAIQLRDKQLGDRELLARARLLRTLTRETKTLCIVNDRPDLAALAGADGVHVGQEEISVKDARQIVGPEALVGVSTHSIEQARQAVFDGASYIGVGPTFPSETKQFEQFPGIALLQAVAAEIRLPAFAIGGITAENLAEVLAAGFSRIAVSGAVSSAADPAEGARGLLRRLVSME
jgi:thiamine-phosphate pyrophosphorylase